MINKTMKIYYNITDTGIYFYDERGYINNQCPAIQIEHYTDPYKHNTKYWVEINKEIKTERIGKAKAIKEALKIFEQLKQEKVNIIFIKENR